MLEKIIVGIASVFTATTLTFAQDCKVRTVERLQNPSQELMKMPSALKFKPEQLGRRVTLCVFDGYHPVLVTGKLGILYYMTRQRR